MMRMGRVMLRWFVFLAAAALIANAQEEKKDLSLDEIFNSPTFAGKTVSGVHWMNDGSRFSSYERDTASDAVNIVIHDVRRGTKTVLLNTSSLKLHDDDPTFRFITYQWSPDERNILFISAPPAREYLSRLTPAGNIFLYDLKTKLFHRLTNVAVPQYNVKFSPDGKSLGFVRGNNIFIMDLATGEERQLTMDGGEHIINGRFDWVYEEEFEISDGWRWSPDSKHIAFWRLDENRVPQYTMTEWDSLHLTLIPMRYPKAGEQNSIVKIGVVDIATKATQWMDLGPNEDIYIPRMQWTLDPGVLAIERSEPGTKC